MAWIYDIILNGQTVINSGDEEFDTKAEAQADADDYIISELCDEYEANANEFTVNCYEQFLGGNKE